MNDSDPLHFFDLYSNQPGSWVRLKFPEVYPGMLRLTCCIFDLKELPNHGHRTH